MRSEAPHRSTILPGLNVRIHQIIDWLPSFAGIATLLIQSSLTLDTNKKDPLIFLEERSFYWQSWSKTMHSHRLFYPNA